MLEAAAFIFSVLILVTLLFQSALILGAPWGEYAMGGTHPGRYPLKLRVAAFVQAALLAVTALVVLTRAEVILPVGQGFAEVAIWFVVVLMAVSFVLNLITKSKWERRIWAPVALLLLLSSLVVALM